MEKYSCKNCINLKTRLVRKEHIENISREELKVAIRQHNIEALNLLFPFNFTVYKRAMKFGECRIIYCFNGMGIRDVYVYKKNIQEITPEIQPCPKYK
jgi:hypothetical protein